MGEEGTDSGLAKGITTEEPLCQRGGHALEASRREARAWMLHLCTLRMRLTWKLPHGAEGRGALLGEARKRTRSSPCGVRLGLSDERCTLLAAEEWRARDAGEVGASEWYRCAQVECAAYAGLPF